VITLKADHYWTVNLEFDNKAESRKVAKRNYARPTVVLDSVNSTVHEKVKKVIKSFFKESNVCLKLEKYMT
jgi:hypothetical protein